MHPQAKQALSKCACRWHPCPCQQGTWKTAHPLCNQSQGLWFFFGSTCLHLGKDWGCNPCAVCKPGAGMGECKGKFLEWHSWWVLWCHSEKSLTSPTNTQSFTCFRQTRVLVHTDCVVFYLGDVSQHLGKHRENSPWSWTSNLHVVRWIRWIHPHSDHIH